jgi:hypothetical protein
MRLWRFDDTAGRFELQQSEGALDVMLMENAVDRKGTSLKIVRGWLRVPVHQEKRRSFAPPGRWITIRKTKKGTSHVHVLGPSWWRHPVYAWATRRIEGTGRERIWLPADARGLGVDGREIATEHIEMEIVIR